MPLNSGDQRVPKLAAHVRLQKDAARGGVVLLSPEGITELNETAAEIVQFCNGTRTVDGVIQELAVEYDLAPESLTEDVLECLDELHARRLVMW
jgi:pyrroloquinoline quinone biosynthesis protein D